MHLQIKAELELDGRWIAAVPELPGTPVYGTTQDGPVRQVKALALRVIADRLENGERVPAAAEVFQVAA
jgi:predicted RNase H-like HicB family nuclease